MSPEGELGLQQSLRNCQMLSEKTTLCSTLTMCISCFPSVQFCHTRISTRGFLSAIDCTAVQGLRAPYSGFCIFLGCWCGIFFAFNSITCTQGGQHTHRHTQSWLGCSSFVILMIIYNSQVACLCGLLSVAACRPQLPCIFGKQYQVSKHARGKIEREKE